MILCDRNYPSYFHLATLFKSKKFVIRCSAASFNQAREMLKQQVNHVVSFNAIKNQAIQLLCSDESSDY